MTSRGLVVVATVFVVACASASRVTLSSACERSAFACVADAEEYFEADRTADAVVALREACAREAQLCTRLAALARRRLLDAGESDWARALLIHECERGDRASCTEAAMLLVAQDAGQRERDALATRACSVGDSSACRALARGDAGLVMTAQALALDEVWCAEGNAPACERLTAESLTEVSWSGPGVLDARLRACDRGRRTACVSLPERSPLSDPADCVAGDATACVEIASEIREGGTLLRDRDLAGRLDAWACGVGQVFGCYGAAEDLAPDSGPELSAPLTVHFYRRACALGSSWACSSVATAIEAAEPLEADRLRKRAATTAIDSCAAGDWDDCAFATYSLNAGRWVDQDFLRATRLYEDWCDGTGDLLACSRAGWALYLGFYADPEPARAAPLLRRACEAGGPRACRAVAGVGDAGAVPLPVETRIGTESRSTPGLALDLTGGTICLADASDACIARESALDLELLFRLHEVTACLTENAKPGQVSLLFSRSADPRVAKWTLETPEDGSELLRCVAGRARAWKLRFKTPLSPRVERYTWSLNWLN